MQIKEIQSNVSQTYLDAFGSTPLRQRLEDIRGETDELCRYTDLRNLREETGDLLSSLIQLCNEAGWSVDELIGENLSKIRRRMSQYHGLGRKKKVALFGGAFDPITNGHIEVAKLVLDTSKTFDEVWFMPCYQHMYNKQMTPAEDRLAMCELAIDDARIKTFDFEIRNQFAGETYHTVKQLLDEDFAKHTHDFSMIIGMDNANTFHQWVNFEDLERMIRFVVVPRKGEDRDSTTDWYLKRPHIYLSPDNSIPQISSSKIREWFRAFHVNVSHGGDANENQRLTNLLLDNLSQKVFDYMMCHRLYDVED